MRFLQIHVSRSWNRKGMENIENNFETLSSRSARQVPRQSIPQLQTLLLRNTGKSYSEKIFLLNPSDKCLSLQVNNEKTSQQVVFRDLSIT